MISANHPFQKRSLNALDENSNEGCASCGRPRDVHPEPASAATPGPGSCGCPETDGKVYHQRETCTDPVVAKLDWYADAGRIGAAPEPVSAGRAPGQAVREALLTWQAQPASWMSAEPWDQLPSWLRKKWESIAQAAIDAATEGSLRACGYTLADVGRFLEAEAAAREPHAATVPAGCECGHAQTGHAFSDDVCAVPDCPCPGYRSTPRAVAAPELAAAMAAHRRTLEWFTGDVTRHARVTRAQLAHAYQDGGLTVPEDLRRFL